MAVLPSQADAGLKMSRNYVLEPIMNLPSMRCGERAKVLGKSMAFSLCAVLVAAGCSGGGSSGSGTPRSNENLNVGGPDTIGNTLDQARSVRVGDGIVESFINTPGDIDYFTFDLHGGNLYGIQFAGLHSSNVEGNLGRVEYSIQYFAPGSEPGNFDTFPSIGTLAFPSGVDTDEDTANLADIFVPPYSGRYYLRFSGERANDVGQYRFRIASSRLGESIPRGDARLSDDPTSLGFTRNRRSYVQIFDPDDGFELFEGPATSFTDSSSTYLEGELAVPWIAVYGVRLNVGEPAFFDTEVETLDTIPYTYPEVFFKDQEGVTNDDPETNSVHIHFGIPSGDLNDDIDDTAWFGESPGNTFQNFRPSINLQDSTDDHPTIVAIDGESEATFDLTLLHLIASQDWFMDVHFTTNYAAYPFPIVTSHPQGGIRFFDSAFVLNGFETVPATGSTRELEVVYNDSFQVFYIPYDVDSELAGSPIHVHQGAPGEEGPILINLGTVPELTKRPFLESALLGSQDFVPGVENIIKRLTDAEAKLIRDAAFSTGWYLDVHTEPFFVVKPEIRADARFETNLEIATSTVSFPDALQGSGRQGLVQPDGERTFTLRAVPIPSSE